MFNTITMSEIDSAVEFLRESVGAESVKKGFVKHCVPTAEVMSEVSVDYFPGMRMVIEEVE